MAQIETIGESKGESKPAPLPEPPEPEPVKPKKMPRKKPQQVPHAEQPEAPEERLNAEEWAERIKAEEEAAKEKEELAAKAQPKLMTKEQFMAMRQSAPQTVAPQAPGAQAPVRMATQKPRESIVGRLQANTNAALGIIEPEEQTDNKELEEIGSASGIIGNMKENPKIAGVVTFIGLLMVLMATYIHGSVMAVLLTGILGFGLFVFGLIFVFGHVRKRR